MIRPIKIAIHTDLIRPDRAAHAGATTIDETIRKAAADSAVAIAPHTLVFQLIGIGFEIANRNFDRIDDEYLVTWISHGGER